MEFAPADIETRLQAVRTSAGFENEVTIFENTLQFSVRDFKGQRDGDPAGRFTIKSSCVNDFLVQLHLLIQDRVCREAIYDANNVAEPFSYGSEVISMEEMISVEMTDSGRL